MPIGSSIVSRRGFGRKCEPLPRGCEHLLDRNTATPARGTRRHSGPRQPQTTILGSIGIYSSRSTRSDIKRDDRNDSVSRHISLGGGIYNLARSRAISSKTAIGSRSGYRRQVYEAEISIAPRIVSARGDEREREPPTRDSSSAPAQTRQKLLVVLERVSVSEAGV